MKTQHYINSLILLAILILPYPTFAQQKEALDGVPKIVGKGSVSSRDFEFNFTFHKESKTSFFTKALLPGWRRLSIVQSKQKDNGQWEEPTLASFSGKFRDADPFITPDQSKLIYISDRPSTTKKNDTDYSIWYVELTGKNKEPQLLTGDFYKDIPSPSYPTMALNGNLYFSAFSQAGGSTLYKSVKNADGYGEAIALPFNDAKYIDLDPMIAPDESFIIFASNNRAGVGGQDLFVSFNDNGVWSEPVNLGDKINSRGNDGQPGISSDGRTLYFSTNRMEETITYKPREKKITNSELKKELGSIFNGFPNIWEVDISDIQKLSPIKS